MGNKNFEIQSLGINGEGIAKENGNVFFIPFALPKEIVEVQILKEKENLKFCKLQNVIKKSQFREDPKCKYFGVCGGCNLQHLNYSETLKFKTNLVKESLKKIAGIDKEVCNTIGVSNRYNYRNKMVFPIGKIDDKNVVGMFKEKSHEIVKIKSCEVANSVINKVLKIFSSFLDISQIEGYYNNEQEGCLKYLSCRVLDGIPSITVVSKIDVSKNLKMFEELIKKEFENYSLWLNINNKKTSEILSNNFKFIGGKKELEVNELGIKYNVHPYSFMQINNEIKSKLYNKILENIDEAKVVVDAYSGAGLLSAIISRNAKKVYGIEIIKTATNDANLLKDLNKIRNLDNINGDAAKILPNLIKTENDMVVVLDPPKAGVDKKLLDVLNNSNVQKVIYVACGLTTLCRDLKILKERFEITLVQPYDMFPNTNHVETLVCLQRRVERK